MLAEIDCSTMPGIKESRRQQAERSLSPPPSLDVPATIIFKMNAEGDHLTVRNDDLEVGFALDGGCTFLVWGTGTGCPCSYANSNCPEDKNRDWRNCPVADNCPYEITKAIEEDCTVMTSSEGTSLNGKRRYGICSRTGVTALRMIRSGRNLSPRC